ncbi:MAG: hypothetical protein ACT4O4_02965 [Nitrospiraceae bacterium]
MDTYVSTTGNNANACGAGIGSPKATIQNAVTNCGGTGNRVIVRNGTYAQSVEITTGGTPASPFILMAENPRGAVLDGPVVGQGEMQWGIEIVVCNVVVDGFEVKEFGGLGGQAAGIGTRSCASDSSVTEVRNNWIHHISGVDNPAGFKYLGDYRGTLTIHNNEMNNSTGGAATENNAGVMFFGEQIAGGTHNLTVRNNLIYNMGSGFAGKHAALVGTTNIVVEKNIMHDVNTQAQVASCFYSEQRGTIFRMNICYNHRNLEGGGIGIWPVAFSDGDNSQIINNCFYNVDRGIRAGDGAGINLTIRDNIFSVATTGQQAGVTLSGTLASHNPTMDFNNYADGAVSRTLVQNYPGASTTSTFTQLQGLGKEANGRSGSPGWVNPPTDFHLTAGSANRNAGTGGNDIGCYPTRTEVIGPTGVSGGGGSGDTVPPAAPANLRIT